MSQSESFFAGLCMAYHETDRPWHCMDAEGHEGWCDGAEGHTPKGCTCTDAHTTDSNPSSPETPS